jgi:hypothetical protein
MVQGCPDCLRSTDIHWLILAPPFTGKMTSIRWADSSLKEYICTFLIFAVPCGKTPVTKLPASGPQCKEYLRYSSKSANLHPHEIQSTTSVMTPEPTVLPPSRMAVAIHWCLSKRNDRFDTGYRDRVLAQYNRRTGSADVPGVTPEQVGRFYRLLWNLEAGHF